MKKINSKLIKYAKVASSASGAGIIGAEVAMLRFLLGSFAVLAFLYILFLGNMVFDIVERRGLEADARVLANEVRDLELVYLGLSSEVDLELAYSMGFREASPTFITRKPLGFNLTASQNGI
jgi:hypothetical protein